MNDIEVATKKQLYALYCLYKKDFRKQGLTRIQASKLIADAKGQQPTLFDLPPIEELKLLDFLKSNSESIVQTIKNQTTIKSIVSNDTSLVKDDGKKYAMYGSGCAVAFFQYRGNNKRAEKVAKEFSSIRTQFTNYIINQYFTSDEIKKYELFAMMFQNIAILDCIYSIVIDYSIKINIKGMTFTSRLD